MSSEYLLLLEDEGGKAVRGEEVESHLLYVGGGDGIDFSVEAVEVALFVFEEEGFTEVEGKLLAVVAGDGYLTFQLLLGGSECRWCQGAGHELVKFASYESAATLDVVGIAPKVDGPYTSIAISHHSALNSVNKSVALT